MQKYRCCVREKLDGVVEKIEHIEARRIAGMGAIFNVQAAERVSISSTRLAGVQSWLTAGIQRIPHTPRSPRIGATHLPFPRDIVRA